MSAIGFRCPDGKTVKFKDCLKGNCGHRCMALPQTKSGLEARERGVHGLYRVGDKKDV